MQLRRRAYVVWHQDSPGRRVTVFRHRKPSIPFSRAGEALAYGTPGTFPPAIDLTKEKK